MVILADFILEFRFEFLWPFWLLLRSVYDSFKYQGLVSVDVAHVAGSNAVAYYAKSHCLFSLFLSLSLSGLLCIFYLYCTYVRHDLLLFHPCALAVFCCQHLCLGAIRLAHRYVDKFHESMNNDVMYISKYMISHTAMIRGVFVEATRLLVGILIVNGY